MVVVHMRVVVVAVLGRESVEGPLQGHALLLLPRCAHLQPRDGNRRRRKKRRKRNKGEGGKEGENNGKEEVEKREKGKKQEEKEKQRGKKCKWLKKEMEKM